MILEIKDDLHARNCLIQNTPFIQGKGYFPNHHSSRITLALRKSIRFHYGVDPIHLEPLTDQTYTFMSGSNKFILKKSTLNENQLPLWERVFHIANQENLSSILPVYLTNTSEMYMMHDGHIFYLSPYMDSKPIQVKDFYQKLGHIHRKTKTEYTINPIEIKRSFQDYQKKCKENKKILLSYVEYFEQQQHMSPLALQVCTHYRDLQRIFEILDHKVAEMLREREEKVTWSTSLCHGNLSFSHLLFKQNLYFFNWEKASFQNAIQDLYQFFQKETDAYDAPIDDFIHQFEFYLEENELS